MGIDGAAELPARPSEPGDQARPRAGRGARARLLSPLVRALDRLSPRLRGATATFAVSGLVAVLVVGGAGVYVLSRIGQAEAIRDARTTTRVIGRSVVEPAIRDELLRGDAAAVAALDEIVRGRVLGDGVVRVKLWTGDGRVVYSDEPRLIGRQFAENDHFTRALAVGVSAEKAHDFAGPENEFERDLGTLLEVYLPLRAPSGEPVLFETYQSYDAVASGGRRVWLAFLPAILAALILLWLIQIPLAWTMGRRVASGRAERERLLRRALEASDLERRRIAGDLHDGVVQDLAGVSYSLTALADRLGAGEPQAGEALAAAAASTRQSARRLRSLLVDVYPPNLQSVGLAGALEDLVAPAIARGIHVVLGVEQGLQLPLEAQLLVYRVAQEGVRNAVSHAGASRLSISLGAQDGIAQLTIEDDGAGFAPEQLELARADGHLGLQLLTDLARDAGGELSVTSAPGRGTILALTLEAS